MLQGSIGIVPTLQQTLKSMEGIDAAYIYGSLAKGEADAASDIDLLIIGQPEQSALASVIRRAENMLHREINYTLLKSQELKRKLKTRDPFVTNIWEGKRITVIDDEQNETTTN